MNTAGLSTDQAPPFAVPLAWYAWIPLSVVAAGALLMAQGSRLLATGWLQPTAGLAHLGTLGLLGAAMAGSLYQMVPVVAGASVPWPRLAHAVAGLFAFGAAALVYGLVAGEPTSMRWATWALGASLTVLVLQVGTALAQSPVSEPSVRGMKLALLCLVALAGLGLRLAWGHATGQLPMERQALLTAHIALGLLGWVGALLGAVSWQIAPMFWFAAAPPPRWPRNYLGSLAISLALTLILALLGAPWLAVALAAAPAAVAVWAVQPWHLWRQIQARRRKRPDPSLQLWQLSLLCAPLTLVVAVLLLVLDWGPLGPLFGWLAVWGWAGAAVHSALAKIVPFLAWFHRFTQTGDQPELQARVPPMKQLLPDQRVRLGLYSHTAALVLGILAIVTGLDVLARLAGLAVAATGVLLAGELALPVWRAWRVR